MSKVFMCKGCGIEFKYGNRKQSVCLKCCKTYWRMKNGRLVKGGKKS